MGRKKTIVGMLISWLINISIGVLIIFGALTFAGYKNVNLGQGLSVITKILTGHGQEAATIAKGMFNNETEQTNNTNTTPTNTQQSQYRPLQFSNSKQLVLGEYDNLGRATSSHIQLSYRDKPSEGREPYITYDPVGWHNYRFTYQKSDSSTSKAWLNNRGHLVGYLFSGLGSEGKNLVPLTRYVNAGTVADDKMDSSNPNGMLYYEIRLNNWLKKYPNNYLDYYVVPNYEGNNLIPSTITMYWTGFDRDGNQILVSLNEPGLSKSQELYSSVTLNNSSPNANINYADGTATQK